MTDEKILKREKITGQRPEEGQAEDQGKGGLTGLEEGVQIW